jgi:hypothetical protein
MSMKPVFVALAIASATLATTGAAHAGGIGGFGGGFCVEGFCGYVGPGYDLDGRHYDNWGISRDQAIRIAKDNGVRYVEDVDRTRRYYIVSGETRRHHDISVTIDRSDGDVVEIDR